MKTYTKIVVLALVSALSASVAFSQEVTLNAEQILAALKDRGMKTVSDHKVLNVVTETTYFPDGTAVSNTSNDGTDKATWEISSKDNFLRLNYKTWGQGCFRVAEKDKKLTFYGCVSGRVLLIEK